MIGLDTNILVRYFSQDDPVQSRKVLALFKTRLTRESPGHVNVVTLVETVWVLRRLYGADRAEAAHVVGSLLAAPNVVVERKPLVRKALQDYEGSACDFNDCLIERLNTEAGCTVTLTFDRAASKQHGFELLA